MSTILVIDDQPQFFEMLKILFSDSEWDLHYAKDPITAITRYAEGDIDVVLCDLHMSEGSGTACLSALRREDPLLVGVIATQDPQNEIALEALRAGVFDLISKPFGASEIEDTLSNALEERERRIELTEPKIIKVEPGNSRPPIRIESPEQYREQANLLEEREAFVRKSEETIIQRMHELMTKEAELEQMREDVMRTAG
ncbi:MAG: response regulator [Verrucomicrobiota bacterium]